MENRALYLDYAASAPIRQEVLSAMLPWLSRPHNAGAKHHSYGNDAAQAVLTARTQIAAHINANPDEIIFTSGATEANNLALFGLAQYLKAQGKTHIITCAVEHKSILEPLKNLEGFKVSVLPVKSCAMIEATAIEKALTAETGLVIIQAVNNETGTIQPVSEIAAILKERDVLFHVDAAQALGKIELDIAQFQVDTMSLSAHKIGGPQGIGALYISKQHQDKISPLFFGGGQEMGLRAGTLPTALCVGFGTACENIQINRKKLQEMRNNFLHTLAPLKPIIHGHTDPAWNVPGIINLRFPGIDNETLVMALPELAFGLGSACSSHGEQYSHVIKAIAGQQASREAIRVSFGDCMNIEELQYAAGLIFEAVENIRQLQEAA